MTTSLDPNAALILIDIQDGFDDPSLGSRNNPDAERNAARLLAAWRLEGRPLVHIQHHSVNPNSPLWPEKPGVAIKSIVAPRDGEPLMTKTVNNAFVGTGLEGFLRERQIQIRQVIIVGLTSNHRSTPRPGWPGISDSIPSSCRTPPPHSTGQDRTASPGRRRRFTPSPWRISLTSSPKSR